MMDIKILFALLWATIVGLCFYVAGAVASAAVAIFLAGADSGEATLIGFLAGIAFGVLGFVWYYNAYRSHQERRDADDASVDSDITTAERLRQLKRLLDEDVISESEFAAKKAELLKDL